MENDNAFIGDILIENSKIKKIQSSIEELSAEIIDVNGSRVMPGFIDGHSHIGLIEDGIGFAGNDTDEVSCPVTPELSPLYGINIFDRSFQEALEAGVTTVAVSPGQSNVIGGQTCIIKTYGKDLNERIVKPLAAINANLGNSPKRSNFGKVEMPMSRMAEAYLLRKALKETQYYLKEKKMNGDKMKLSHFNMKYESLGEVIMKKIPLRIAARKAEDILTAISISEEFDIRILLDYCTEGYLIADEIIKRNIPVMLGPYITDTSDDELINMNPYDAALFSNSGILTSLISNHPEVPENLLLICVSIAVKEGMKPIEALKAITINPAKALGIDSTVGSLREGKDADIIVLSGDPFSIKTDILLTIINGNIAYKK